MRRVLRVLLFLLLASSPAIGQVRFEDGHITVQMSVSHELRPRHATLAFALQDSGDSREDAARAVASRVRGMSTALARLGLRGDAVTVGEAAHLRGPRVEMRFPKVLREVGTPGTKSFGYRIAVDTAYVVNEAVTVRAPLGATLRRAVDEARRAGAAWVTEPQYGGGWVGDDRLELLARDALNAARAAAEREARASGGRLGRLVSTRRDTSRPPQMALRFTHLDSISSAAFASAPSRVPAVLTLHARWEYVGPGGRAAEQVGRREAIGVLQGSGGEPRIPEARIARVARALAAAREAYPRLADIGNTRARRSLTLAIHDSAARTVRRRAVRIPHVPDPDDWVIPVRSVGVPAIDSLSRSYGITRFWLDTHGRGASVSLEVASGEALDLDALGARYERIPQVQFTWHEPGTDGSWIALLDKGAHLLFVFARGGGDCPAGCTEWDHYYVDYDTLTGRATLEHQQLQQSGVPWWQTPIMHWDTPTRYSINAYRSLADVYRGSSDSRWWYRRHAVWVLTLLLGPDDGPWHGAGEQSPTLFRELKSQALARRRDSYERLIELLVDPDVDVARAAHAALRELTKKDFPGGRDGMPRWRTWLQSQPASSARPTAPVVRSPAAPRPVPPPRRPAPAR